MTKIAFAVGAHPDDIEFMMGGTMLLLKEAGYELHYMNIANGSCGTNEYDKETIIKMRREEGMESAKCMGAVFHESLTDDLDIFYERDTLKKLSSVMREVAPDIVLTLYPFDYMEDHCNAARLAVSAAFFRGMKNFEVTPPAEVTGKEVSVYHAMPYGLYDPMRKLVKPELFVDVSTTIPRKREILAKHESQKKWLDDSQGMDSFLIEMESHARECGKNSGQFEYAEGWIRRLHLGFCSKENNPISDALNEKVFMNPEY